MGWSNNYFSLIIVVVSPSGFSGLFVYSPSPGTGNLDVSITAASGTDPYGNQYEEGVNVYDAAGNIQTQLAPYGLQVSTAALTVLGRLQALTSPEAAFYLTGAAISQVMSDPIAAVLPGSPPSPAPETWHTPALTGFANVINDQPVEYRLNALGNVEVTGTMEASAAYTAGTTIWTVTADYRPAAIAAVALVIDTAGTYTPGTLTVTTAGEISIGQNVANAALVIFGGGSYRIAA